MSLNEKLIAIQSSLKVPKTQTNAFGKYKYRSCEDILEAVKPLANQQGCSVTLTDEPVQIGERVYIKATATLNDGESTICTHGYAREEQDKKGMDACQITGAASSYARKYALNGLFCIDDTKDSDATNEHDKTKPAQKTAAGVDDRPSLTKVLESLTDSKDFARLQLVYDRAMTFEWPAGDRQGIADCYANMKKRFMTSAAS